MNLLELAFYVKRGKNRSKVFEALESPAMPSDIVRKIYGKVSNSHFNIVSRALSELMSVGLVKNINPKERTGRIYQLTPLGRNVKDKLREVQ